MDMDELRTEVRNTRKRRGWTQQDLADAAGVYIGTISNFERGAVAPQPHILRDILKALDLEREAGDAQASETRSEWPADIKTFLDIMGLFLAAIPEGERTEVMRDITRQVVNR